MHAHNGPWSHPALIPVPFPWHSRTVPLPTSVSLLFYNLMNSVHAAYWNVSFSCLDPEQVTPATIRSWTQQAQHIQKAAYHNNPPTLQLLHCFWPHSTPHLPPALGRENPFIFRGSLLLWELLDLLALLVRPMSFIDALAPCSRCPFYLFEPEWPLQSRPPVSETYMTAFRP